jgi:hypothetical protein
MIYLKLNESFGSEDVRWSIITRVSNGTIRLSYGKSLSNLNQAEINLILNKMSYEPFRSTSIDTLSIQVRSEKVTVSCSLTILVFSKWVTILTKTMRTIDRWPVVQRLAASVERYFPQTKVLIASDSGQKIDKVAFLNFTLFNNIQGYDLLKTLFIHNMPEDSGLSTCRNYLVNITKTPFFFLFDDDFELEEDSHLDLLLELIYTHPHIDIIAGKIPEDIRDFKDFSGIFLVYNETLELVSHVPYGRKDQVLFHRSSNEKVDKTNPCRQVDFVPNVFMGRTESVRSVYWYDDFKVGEHEDFFLRFGQANRTVYSCDFIHVHHHQIPWWKKADKSYYLKRTRAYRYFEQMLMNHNLKRLIVFDYVHVDLDKNPPGSTNSSTI